jgi:outer membrane protein assembly factor BamB
MLSSPCPGHAHVHTPKHAARSTREFKNPQVAGMERTKALAILQGHDHYSAPDGYVVALDDTTGKVKWEI